MCCLFQDKKSADKDSVKSKKRGEDNGEFHMLIKRKINIHNQRCRKYSPACQMRIKILTDELKNAATSPTGDL